MHYWVPWNLSKYGIDSWFYYNVLIFFFSFCCFSFVMHFLCCYHCFWFPLILYLGLCGPMHLLCLLLWWRSTLTLISSVFVGSSFLKPSSFTVLMCQGWKGFCWYWKLYSFFWSSMLTFFLVRMVVTVAVCKDALISEFMINELYELANWIVELRCSGWLNFSRS